MGDEEVGSTPASDEVRLIWTTRADCGDFVDAVVDRVAPLSERGYK